MKQIITTIGPATTSSSARYTQLFGINGGFTPDETATQIPWSVAGTFSHLKIYLFEAPGTGKSATFTLRKNGSDTAVTVTISDTGQVATDSTHSFTVSPGDLLSMKRTASTTMSSGMYYAMYLEFDSSATGESGYSYLAATILSAAKGGRFFFASGLSTNATSPLTYQDISPIDGTVTRIDLVATKSSAVATPFSSGESISVVVYKNNVAQDGSGGTPNTTMNVVGNGSTTATSWTGTLSVAVGDTLHIVATPTGSAFGLQTVQVHMGVRFVATTDGQFVFTNITTASATTDRYVSPTGADYTETEATLEGIGGTTTFYVSAPQMGGVPGGTTRFLATGRLNGATPSSTFTGSASDGEDGSNIRLALVGTTTVPSVAHMTITDSDRWDVLLRASTQLVGSMAIGNQSTVAGATQAILFNCTDAPVTLSTDRTFQVSADNIILDGSVTMPTFDISAALDTLGY